MNGYSHSDWQKHYDEDDLKWDIGEVSPAIQWLWKENKLPQGKAIVPGCGQGHEVVYLAERGLQVTGVDFAEGAVKLLRHSLATKGLQGQVLQRNFFELEAEHDACYDLLLEQTFFCAILPEDRLKYVATAGRILKPGALLAGLFYETGEEGGPPFNTTREDIVKIFSEEFAIEYLEKTAYSVEQRAEKELLALLRKKSGG
jgi:SAM-dependent methyltransferase